MSRYNTVPVAVQQMVESLKSQSTPASVKFNQAQVLETTRDYCEVALREWKKEQLKAQQKKR